MTNWWNEVFIEEGWYDQNEEKDEKTETENRAIKCEFCGTRTGMHGFSFDTKGVY